MAKNILVTGGKDAPSDEPSRDNARIQATRRVVLTVLGGVLVLVFVSHSAASLCV